MANSSEMDCLSCFWHSLANIMDVKQGYICRRNPPGVTVNIVPGAQGQIIPVTSSAFPPVRKGDWCGEFKPQKSLITSAPEPLAPRGGLSVTP